MEKLRVGAVVLILTMFTVSVFTQFPVDPGTRTVLNTALLATAGFLYGPSLLKRNGKDDK